MNELEYDAILVDTSIFKRNGLKLENGLLARLKQFSRTQINFLMPDVIKNEILCHLDKEIKDSKISLEKSIQDASSNLFFDGSVLNKAKKLLLNSKEIENLAQSRLEKFITDTNALVIDCNHFVSVQDVLDIYFRNEPPFSDTGKKKCEFPDAITLLAVEKWAETSSKRVLAVASDKDWKNYCESSTNIDYIEDFSEGLSIFNEATAPYALLDNIRKGLEEGSANNFLSGIESGLELALNGFVPDQEAESQLYWEPDGSHGWFKEFELDSNDFKIIETDKDYVVIGAWATITVEAEGDFSLSVYDSFDREYVSMGGVSKTVEEDFESEVLITISGNLSEDINELSIDDVEIVNPITSINFGTLEMDWD